MGRDDLALSPRMAKQPGTVGEAACVAHARRDELHGRPLSRGVQIQMHISSVRDLTAAQRVEAAAQHGSATNIVL